MVADRTSYIRAYFDLIAFRDRDANLRSTLNQPRFREYLKPLALKFRDSYRSKIGQCNSFCAHQRTQPLAFRLRLLRPR